MECEDNKGESLVPDTAMNNELLCDLLTMNREILDVGKSRLEQQAYHHINEAMREASIFATDLQDHDPTMTFEQVCKIAEMRARKHIKQIRQTKRGQIQELKRAFHLRQHLILALCGRRAHQLGLG